MSCLLLRSFSGYLIVAPRTVRASQVYRVDVTIYNMYHDQIVVRASLSRNNEQYAYQTAVFKEASARVVELSVGGPLFQSNELPL